MTHNKQEGAKMRFVIRGKAIEVTEADYLFFSEREMKILELRNMNMTYRSIGLILNVSGSRIRQIGYRALSRFNLHKKNRLFCIGLTVRSICALKKLGINTFEDLQNITEANLMQLRRLRNVGEKTFNEIEALLTKHNIDPKQETH
jgi:DNA-binding CsgD family transcriptional regulator